MAKAKFNVTKTPNTTLSDTEIKQRVINLIDTYSILIIGTLVKIFILQKMAAFIHNNMIGEINDNNRQCSYSVKIALLYFKLIVAVMNYFTYSASK